MKQGTLPEIVPMRIFVLNSWFCEEYSSSGGNNSFYWGVELRHVMEMQETVIIWESIKLASLVLIWISWVVTLWRKILTIFEDMRNMVYEKKLCISRVVVPYEDTWPLEKIMIFHGVDFGQSKYEFCLDMWDTPRIWRDEVLLDIKEV